MLIRCDDIHKMRRRSISAKAEDENNRFVDETQKMPNVLKRTEDLIRLNVAVAEG